MRKIYYRIMFVGILMVLFAFCTFQTVQAQDAPAEVGVIESFEVAPGSTIQVPVYVRGVQELYGVDLTLEFDPDVVQVIDQGPAMEGTQAGLGKFLDPGLLLFNNVDNEAGTLRFTMSQYNPSEPKSGEGILLLISFEGLTEGETTLEITSVSLSTREGVEIPSRGVNNSLVVVSGALEQQITYAVAEATGMILIQTATPTPAPTATSTATLKPLSTATPQPAAPVIGSGTETAVSDSARNPGSFMVNNWWIIPVLLVAVIGIGAKIFMQNKSKRKE